MAIIYTKNLPENKLLLAYNNNVLEFRSDSALRTLKAEMSFFGITLTLFPFPNGLFYFNFKDWITSIINQNNFEDNLNIDLDNQRVYDWTANSYLNTIINVKIIYSNLTFEEGIKNLKWISGYTQIENFKRRYPINDSNTEIVALIPKVNANNNRAFVKYWYGYPFDISFYKTSNYTLKNNILEYIVPSTTNIVERLIFSTGQTDLTLDDDLSLTIGFNEITVTDASTNFYIQIEKIEPRCAGHYVKWINSLGGYSYWLFEEGNLNRRTNDLGELQNDFDNLGGTISPTIQIGKTSIDSLRVTTDTIEDYEIDFIEDIIDSPKVYLFTGQPFAKNNFNDWVEVNLKPGDFRIRNAKNSKNSINFTLELPERVTRRI